MKTLSRVLVSGAVVALITGVVAPGPGRAIDPPPEEPLAQMTQMMGRMQESVQQMQGEMQHTPGMGAMHGRMRHTMGMMEQMHGMMRQHREQMQRHCAPASPAPKAD